MAKRARALAQLDTVIWLVSPQNPLKPVDGMAPFTARLDACQMLAKPYNWLIVSDFETHIQTTSGHHQQPVTTAETLSYLRRLMPLNKLIWIMGADNLLQFDQWDNYQMIPDLADLLILGRPGYNYAALANAKRLQLGTRTSPRQLGQLIVNTTAGTQIRRKNWAFDLGAYNRLSSTELRRAGKGL